MTPRIRMRLVLASFAVASALFGATFARGAAVFLVGEAEPVYGYLVSANDEVVILQVPQADGSRKEEVYPRERVQDLLVTVAPERLESLAPPDPLPYLQYAEELAVKKQDPEARDAARRLFLIAGALSPEAHGRQAALGLATVAVDTAESNRARALASLVDPSAAPVETSAAPGRAAEKVDPSFARIILAGIQSYRRGEVEKAKRAFAQDLSPLAGADPQVPIDRLKETLGETNFEPDREVLAALVPLERSLRNSGTVADAASRVAVDPFSPEARLPVAWPTWKNVTPFDPEETIFRGGEWQRP